MDSLIQTDVKISKFPSDHFHRTSGASRGGTWGACPPLILGRKRKNLGRKKSQQGKKTRTSPLVQNLDPPLRTVVMSYNFQVPIQGSEKVSGLQKSNNASLDRFT